MQVRLLRPRRPRSGRGRSGDHRSPHRHRLGRPAAGDRTEHPPGPHLISAQGVRRPVGDRRAAARVRPRAAAGVHRSPGRAAPYRAGQGVGRAGAAGVPADGCARAVARAVPGGHRYPAVVGRPGGAPGEHQDRCDIYAYRCASRPRRARVTGIGVGTPHQRAPVPRGPAQPADARALPVRAAGRRARHLPATAAQPRCGTGDRPRSCGTRTRGRHPPSGPHHRPHRAGRRRGGHTTRCRGDGGRGGTRTPATAGRRAGFRRPDQ